MRKPTASQGLVIQVRVAIMMLSQFGDFEHLQMVVEISQPPSGWVTFARVSQALQRLGPWRCLRGRLLLGIPSEFRLKWHQLGAVFEPWTLKPWIQSYPENHIIPMNIPVVIPHSTCSMLPNDLTPLDPAKSCHSKVTPAAKSWNVAGERPPRLVGHAPVARWRNYGMSL